MNRTTFSLEIFGDRLPIATKGATNEKQLEYMKRSLEKAIKSDLTERQRQMVTEYYFDGKSVTKLAEEYGLSKSTVSRHLSRSREKLKSTLKYGMYTLWSDD